MLTSLLIPAPLEIVLERVLACAARCGLEPDRFGEHQLTLQDPDRGLGLTLRFEASGARSDRWLVLGAPTAPESLESLQRLHQLMRCLQEDTSRSA